MEIHLNSTAKTHNAIESDGNRWGSITYASYCKLRKIIGLDNSLKKKNVLIYSKLTNM